MPSSAALSDLFGHSALPEGFRYRPDVLSPDEERALIDDITALDLRPFQFHGFLGKRRTASFGWRYDFNGAGLGPTLPIPDFLLPVRERAAALAGAAPACFEHALVTEYAPGAAIGWHRDRPEFGRVVGISLFAACTLRFRRRRGASWQRASIVPMPRSAYLLDGPARSQWEHSIPAVTSLRYSITFRELRSRLSGDVP